MSDSSPQPGFEGSRPPSAAVPSWFVRGVAIAFVLVAGLVLVLDLDAPTPQITRGASAPDFVLPRMGDGASVALADKRGTVVLVNFWATWCKPCEDEMPSMERLYQALSPDGFELLAVSVDETETDVASFAQRLGISFPILLDPTKQVSLLYQTTGFPESLLVDRDGVIVERYVGPRDWDHPGFAQRIRKLMAAR